MEESFAILPEDGPEFDEEGGEAGRAQTEHLLTERQRAVLSYVGFTGECFPGPASKRSHGIQATSLYSTEEIRSLLHNATRLLRNVTKPTSTLTHTVGNVAR